MPLAKDYKNPFGKNPLGTFSNRGVRLPSGEMFDLQEQNQTVPPTPMSPLPPAAAGQPDYRGLFGGMLDRGIADAEQNRVTREDIDANQNAQLIRNALAGFSKAAANVGGTETTVPGVAEGFNKADSQALASRDRLANQGFDLQQAGIQGLQNEDFRPLKLESAQLGLESARRSNDMQIQAADPTSELSQNVRQFYRERIGINFPDNISAQNIEAYVKDPAITKMGYENQAKLQQQSQAFNARQAADDRRFRLEEREKDRELQESLMALRSAANPKDRVYNSLPEPQKIAVKELSTDASKKQAIANQIDGYLKQWDEAKTDTGRTQIGQQMIKLLNSAQGQDAVGAEEARRLANELEPYTFKSPSGLPRLGQDLKAFKTRAEAVGKSLRNTVKTNQEQVQQIYQQFAPQSPAAQPLTAPASVQPVKSGRPVWTPNQQAGR